MQTTQQYKIVDDANGIQWTNLLRALSVIDVERGISFWFRVVGQRVFSAILCMGILNISWRK